MRVTLVSPPGAYIDRSPSIGICYLAAILEKNSIDVKIIDANIIKFYSPDLSKETLVKMILGTKPDVIGISTLSDTHLYAIGLAKMIKKRKNIPIVFGGVQSTYTAVPTLKAFPWIDFVVGGEGEITFLELLKALESKSDLKNVKGIFYRDNDGKIVKTEERQFISDIDTIPFPAYHLIPPLNLYSSSIEVVAPMITTRGCPYNCIYCSGPKMWKRNPRFRGTPNIFDEIKHLKNKHGVTAIKFVDDTFTLNKKRVFDVCDFMKSENLKWDCLARVDTVDAEMLKKMKEAGCCRIFYGIESGSINTLKYMQKTITPEMSLKVVEKTLEIGIICITSFIIGLPNETRDDIEKTLALAKKMQRMGAIVSIYALVPLAGSEVLEEFKEKLLPTEPFAMLTVVSRKKLDKIEKKWVNKYPDIFSNFYYVPTSCIDYKTVRKLLKEYIIEMNPSSVHQSFL